MTMSTVVPVAHTLGNPKLFELLFRKVFSSRQAVAESDARAYCIATAYRAGSQFSGAIAILVNTGILETESGLLRPGKHFDVVFDKHNLSLSIAKQISLALQEAGELTDVFVAGSLTREGSDNGVYLHVSKIPLRYLPLIKLFRELGTLTPIGGSNALLKVTDILSAILTDAIYQEGPKLGRQKGLSPEQLATLLEAKKRQGEAAEKFVHEYELRRLAGHPGSKSIRRISLDDTGAGYDIVSFDSQSSVIPDRFIEVKSFLEYEHFYLSSGEARASEVFQDSYYLYLVDISRISEQAYVPKIIRNPYKYIFVEGQEYRVQTDAFLIELAIPK